VPRSSVIETERLLLRPPAPEDAEPIFERYASDAEVTRYLGWPRHTSIQDTRAFVGFSLAEWARWGVGPLIIFNRVSGTLVGASGLVMEASARAATGYVLARDAWGKGYATESLHAMIALAAEFKVTRLYALCHVDHRASQRVLEKCRFQREGVLPRHSVFPNLSPEPLDVLSYARSPV
jgi:[ribosomal protein S5]-alanine N-acetyltransferase